MGYHVFLKSGQQLTFTPQIRLTCSKNGMTGTAVFEVDLDQQKFLFDINDPICGISIKKQNLVKTADICQFVWASGRPIRLIAIFIFSTIEEKQKFFNYYYHHSISSELEFFPA